MLINAVEEIVAFVIICVGLEQIGILRVTTLLLLELGRDVAVDASASETGGRGGVRAGGEDGQGREDGENGGEVGEHD